MTIIKQSGAPNPFISALIIVLGVVVGYFFYAQTSDDIQEAPVPPAINDPVFLKMKEARLNFSLFDDSMFAALKIFGEYPVRPGAAGKQDPFAP